MTSLVGVAGVVIGVVFFIIFLYRALSASHFKSRAGRAPQQTRLLEPAVASHSRLLAVSFGRQAK